MGYFWDTQTKTINSIQEIQRIAEEYGLDKGTSQIIIFNKNNQPESTEGIQVGSTYTYLQI